MVEFLLQALDASIKTFFLAQQSLEKFVTTKKDLKKKVDRMPKVQFQNINLSSWQEYMRHQGKGETGTFECVFRRG